MERGIANISDQDLSQSKIDQWATEIRDYLLGRLSADSRAEQLKAWYEEDLTVVQPIRRWWTFEGKQYATVSGPLMQNWDWVILNARRLLETFNPRFRLSDRPDGVVDWGNTLARGPRHQRAEYVLRASGIGLDEDEYAALCGWWSWITAELGAYRGDPEIGTGLELSNRTSDIERTLTVERLRQWAHTAKRSRWPLLHGIVAESLRPMLEPEELDRVPLPSDAAKLFELLCLVRIAREVAPLPNQLRWLSADLCNNTIQLDGVRAYYQQSLDREAVLATYTDPESLKSAINAFGVRVPKFVDIAFDFSDTRGGFDGLIIEAKSGTQQYENSVGQLRTYRAARTRPPGSRYIVWGISETPDQPDLTLEDLQCLFASADQKADVWVFSSAEAIQTVLQATRIHLPG